MDTINNIVFPLQPEIAALAKKSPRNAKYLSSDIQPEIIQVMANMVRNVHASRVKNSEIFMVMVDGTSLYTKIPKMQMSSTIVPIKSTANCGVNYT